jgi:hypothetical protein
MQAPTTPGGPAAQEPVERPCPGCGASNGPLAAFCWQCYRQFGPQGGPGVVQRPGFPPGLGMASRPGVPNPGVPATVPFPAPSSASSTGRVTGAIVLVLALVVAGGVYFLMNRGSAVELPSAFGGLTRIENDQLDAVLDLARAEADAQGAETDVGLYGAGGVPSAALVWVTADGATFEGDPLAEFTAGFESTFADGTLDRTRATSQVSEGVTITCAPIVGSTPSNVCLWQRDGVAWVLVDFSGSRVPDTQTLAVAAVSAA